MCNLQKNKKQLLIHKSLIVLKFSSFTFCIYNRNSCGTGKGVAAIFEIKETGNLNICIGLRNFGNIKDTV